MRTNDKGLILDFKQPLDETISLDTYKETIPIFSKSRRSYTMDNTELQINWDRVKNTTIQQRTNIFNRLFETGDSKLTAKFQVVDNELFYDVSVDGETMIVRFKMRKFFFTHKRKLQRFSVIDNNEKVNISNPLTMFEYDFQRKKRKMIFKLRVTNSEFFKTYVTKRYLGLIEMQKIRIFCKNRRKRLITLSTATLGEENSYSPYFFKIEDKLFEINGRLFCSLDGRFMGVNLLRKKQFHPRNLIKEIEFSPKVLLDGQHDAKSIDTQVLSQYQNFDSYVKSYATLREKSKIRYLIAFMHAYLHTENKLQEFKNLAKGSLLLVGFESNSRPFYLRANSSTIKIFNREFEEIEDLFDVGAVDEQLRIKLVKVRFIHEEDILRIRADLCSDTGDEVVRSFIIFFKIYALGF